MSRLELGPLGIGLSVDAAGAHRDAAAELEQLGYSTIWIPGGQLDSLDRIREVIAATRSVTVVPGIIPIDVYPADEVARLHAELARTAAGRFVVGLGGPQQPRPMRPLGRYLDRLDAADPPVPAGRRIVAALGPRKLALARDRAAGAVSLLVNAGYTAQARAVLGVQPVLVVNQFVVLDADAERARQRARGPLGFLSGVAGYRETWARLGFTAAEIDGLADRLVDELVAWGEPATIVERVRAHRAAGADQVVLSVLDDDPMPVARVLAGALVGGALIGGER